MRRVVNVAYPVLAAACVLGIPPPNVAPTVARRAGVRPVRALVQSLRCECGFPRGADRRYPDPARCGQQYATLRRARTGRQLSSDVRERNAAVPARAGSVLRISVEPPGADNHPLCRWRPSLGGLGFLWVSATLPSTVSGRKQGVATRCDSQRVSRWHRLWIVRHEHLPGVERRGSTNANGFLVRSRQDLLGVPPTRSRGL
jgi:hypothetical protein